MCTWVQLKDRDLRTTAQLAGFLGLDWLPAIDLEDSLTNVPPDDSCLCGVDIPLAAFWSDYVAFQDDSIDSMCWRLAHVEDVRKVAL